MPKLIPPLMRSEQAFCKAAGFEQRVAQQYRVAHALPDRHGDIIPHGDILHQHRIDADADHDKKCLKAQRQQGLQVGLDSCVIDKSVFDG